MSNLRFRPAVLSLPRYKPSKSAPDAVKISSNEMPTPPSPAVLEAIAREVGRGRRAESAGCSCV